MPLPLDLSHKLLIALADIRREEKVMTYLRPDSKSQVTIEYDGQDKAIRIHTIVISTQHDEFDNDDERMLEKIKKDVKEILIPRVVKQLPARLQSLFDDQLILHVNPTGKFVIGGPHGDTGLTGRKIIVDTYGGKGAHGGGAFSGKDPSKVDRSAAYAARHIAKNIVAAGIADEILVQLSYAIGVVEPIGVFVNTFGKSKVDLSDDDIAKKIKEIYDLRPAAIEHGLKLRNPIYLETASYGHMGRTPQIVSKTFSSPYWEPKTVEVELFTWEKLDYVDRFKKADQSISHNGVCLTVVDIENDSYTVTAIRETLEKSNLGLLQVGDKVNLERSTRLDSRLDGHMVQGHVDLTASCTAIDEADGSWYFTFAFEPQGEEHITVEKGSVAVNGVSLTVINSQDKSFQVAIIPFTYNMTNFHQFKVGSVVNLEFDIIGKYIARILKAQLKN